MPGRINETQPRQCKVCGNMKDASQLTLGGARKDGTHHVVNVCKTCYTERQNAYYRKYREKIKASPRRQFMASLWQSRSSAKCKGHASCNATARELEAAFTGKCHVCQVPEIECRVRLCMDHCHKTGRFRGWLCENCNKAAGHLKESAEIAHKLIEYLEQNNEKAEQILAAAGEIS